MRSTQGASAVEHALEVRRVRAVDHVVGGRGARRGVDLRDRVAEAWPLGSRPSVSTVNEIDDRQARRRRAARVTPIASSA